MEIADRIRAYHDAAAHKEHHRNRSWEHCYGYFQRNARVNIRAERHNAALQLGFYLASWGMYRGSGFLLQYAYTVHLGVVDVIAEPRFVPLWESEFGAGAEDTSLTPVVFQAINAIRDAYRQFAEENGSGPPTDTLVTKVILGTFGCLPACDRYFIKGFKSAGFEYSCLNERFVERVSEFSQRNLGAFREEQARIQQETGKRYPLMKLVDMNFHELGTGVAGARPEDA
jgi:hypothetical protein